MSACNCTGACRTGGGCARKPSADWDEYSYSLSGLGQATTLGAEEQDEAIRLLHEAVFEVTGKRVEPAQRRIGFA